MKHNYTDEQLQLTILEASDQRSIFIRTARELEDIDSSAIQSLRTLLYHLPEPGKTYITNVGIQQQIGRLQDLASSEHEAAIWLSTLNHLVATGADRKRILKQDTQDDWQQCTIDQIREGDRVRWQDPGMDDTCTYEIIADHTEAEDPGWILFSRTQSYYFPPGAVVDRIPKPVTPPDPAQHPVIIVHLHNGVKETKRAFVWNGESYGCLDGPHSFLFTYQITKWSPAKVVEDDR